MSECQHPFPVQRVEGRYVVCIQCGKKLADAYGPINEVFNPEDSVEACFCGGRMICPNCGKDWTDEYRKTHPNG